MWSMVRSVARRMGRRRGANAVEFALTLPVFVGLVMGIIDYGFLFMMQSGLDSAVSLACREGSKVDPRRGNPVSIAQSQLASRAAYFCGGACSTLSAGYVPGAQWQVPNLTLQCEAIMPNPRRLVGFVPYPSQIRAKSYYRLEWQRTP
jgi:hypothetical protein